MADFILLKITANLPEWLPEWMIPILLELLLRQTNRFRLQLEIHRFSILTLELQVDKIRKNRI